MASLLKQTISPLARGTAASFRGVVGTRPVVAFARVRFSSTASQESSKDEDGIVESPLNDVKIGFIGSGKMAEAIMSGLLSSNQISPSNIMCSDVSAQRSMSISERYGIRTTQDNRDVAQFADLTVLAVKPQTLNAVTEQLRGHVSKSTLMSVIAGYNIDQIQEATGCESVIRLMPNTPALINQSMTVWTCSDAVPQETKEQARVMMQCFGDELFVANEEMIDMATALCGSGPAYFLMIMEAMIDSGVHLGFPRDTAKRLVLQTMRGSVNLAIRSGMHPSELRNNITSPGGTTAAALYESERGGLRTVISDSIWAAYRRSRELGGLDSCVGPGRFQQTNQLELPDELVDNLKKSHP